MRSNPDECCIESYLGVHHNFGFPSDAAEVVFLFLLIAERMFMLVRLLSIQTAKTLPNVLFVKIIFKPKCPPRIVGANVRLAPGVRASSRPVFSLFVRVRARA